MRISYLILKEAIYGKMNFLLSLLATVTAVALFVSFFTTGEAAKRETTRTMRDMGYNLHIVHKDTDEYEFQATGVSKHYMSQKDVQKFKDLEAIFYNHLTAVLQEGIELEGRRFILTGIASEEVITSRERKSSMSPEIKPGNVQIGSQVADSLGMEDGKSVDKVNILGKSFTITKRLHKTGSIEDIRIYANLSDVQKLLKANGYIEKEDSINTIWALDCRCANPAKDPLTILQVELKRILPDAKVIRLSTIADARKNQREMVDRHLALVMPIVLVVCAAWIGVLAMINVRERQLEIGVMRALGYGSGKITLLFLGKALAIGFVGAAIGFGVGTGLALVFGPDIYKVTAKMIKPEYSLLVWSLIIAPAFAALSSFIPTMVAITQDPAVILRTE